jgi:alpha-ribazole phosphatase
MEIYLIRHTTPLIEKGQIYGRNDVALAESFPEEKDQIIKQLPATFDAIYSSPSSRCTLLSAAIASATGLKTVSSERKNTISGSLVNSGFEQKETSGSNRNEPAGPDANEPAYQTDEALYELNFGDWEGKTWDSIDRTASETWMSDFVHLSPPNGETMLQMEQRILRFWDKLLKQPYKNVCIVTHGGVIRIILARYKSVQLKDAFSIHVGMAEVFKLSLSSL